MTIGITFANQDKLERLPIPTLEETCKSYLEVLVPLQTPKEQVQTEDAIKKFLETSGANSPRSTFAICSVAIQLY